MNRKLIVVLMAAKLGAFGSLAAPPALEVDPDSAAIPRLPAPDSTIPGPYGVHTSEYKLPARVDTEILSDRETELWGAVFRPTSIPSGGAPLLMFLHGNHSTCGRGSNPRIDDNCQYTTRGTCPQGYVVTPNHRGYDYIAKNLASWGYIVVSINANRGITCGGGAGADWGLNLARGRLVLKHLKMWSEWSRRGGAPSSLGVGAGGFVGKVDLGSVGLMGHSRGGEGVRAAYNLYKDAQSHWKRAMPELGIRAIFEIGAVDGQTDRVLDADGVVWNQLLPMCDGDVWDLQGRFPYERMMKKTQEGPYAQKSLQMVWGANHNFFNTEWQQSDSHGCHNHTAIFSKGVGSPEQQVIALASVPAFFRAHVGKNRELSLNRNFNPLHELSKIVRDTTRVERDFTVSPGSLASLVLDDFDKSTGISTHGVSHSRSGVETEHVSLPGPLMAAKVKWRRPGKDVYLETSWTRHGAGRDVTGHRVLEVRFARPHAVIDTNGVATDFSIELVDAIGRSSRRVPVSAFAELLGPSHSDIVTFQTVRIPLRELAEGFDLSRVRGLRLVFDATPAGEIYVANARFSKSYGQGAFAPPPSARRDLCWGGSRRNGVAGRGRPPVIRHDGSKNKVLAIRRLPESEATEGRPAVEIELESSVAFPVRGALPVLKIGRREVLVGRYPEDGSTTRMIFSVEASEFDRAASGEALRVQYGRGEPVGETWEFGGLNKNLGR